jgi:hypothetical protein
MEYSLPKTRSRSNNSNISPFPRAVARAQHGQFTPMKKKQTISHRLHIIEKPDPFDPKVFSQFPFIQIPGQIRGFTLAIPDGSCNAETDGIYLLPTLPRHKSGQNLFKLGELLALEDLLPDQLKLSGNLAIESQHRLCAPDVTRQDHEPYSPLHDFI